MGPSATPDQPGTPPSTAPPAAHPPSTRPDPPYRPGADTNHFLGCCDECDAHYLAKATLGQVDSWFRQGQITPDQLEAFRHVWASSAPRFGDYSTWTAAPVAEVARQAELIRAALLAKEAKPDGRGGRRPWRPASEGPAPVLRQPEVDLVKDDSFHLDLPDQARDTGTGRGL